MPISQISPVARAAIARLVAIVDTQGVAPERIMPNGNRCLNRNSQIGPIPNITSGCR